MSRERKINTTIEISEESKGRRDVEQELFNIWAEFGANETPEGKDMRKKKLEELDRTLTPEEQRLLEGGTGTWKGGQEITVGRLIQEEGLEAGRAKLNSQVREQRIREIEEARERSDGQKRHIRREKAKHRRGTNPRTIH